MIEHSRKVYKDSVGLTEIQRAIMKAEEVQQANKKQEEGKKDGEREQEEERGEEEGEKPVKRQKIK